MPTTSVVRPAKTAPPVGARYKFADGKRSFIGTVVAVKVLNATHATVIVELSVDEHRRLVLGD